MDYKNIELQKINIKLPIGVYKILKENADEKNITLSDIINESISSYLSVDSNILGDEIRNDFYDRLINYLSLAKKGNNYFMHYLRISCLLGGGEEKYKDTSEEKINGVRQLIDELYPEMGNVNKRRLLNLFLFKEESFDKLLDEILRDERVIANEKEQEEFLSKIKL